MTQITTKPDWGVPLTENGVAVPVFQAFLDELELQLNNRLLGDAVQLAGYTVAGLPVVSAPGGMIYVSDEAGGGVPAFSDGTNWRRVTDRAIVS